MEKPFRSIEDQLNILESRNLIIANRESAYNSLVRYGYYEIINGYKKPFMKSNNDDDGFIEGTTFEHLENLHSLDRDIRYSAANALEIFESNVRQAVSYVVAKNISENQNIYVQRTKYNTGRKYPKKYNGHWHDAWPVDDLIFKMKKIVESNSNPVKHYREKYGNVPPWIIVKEMPFGSLIWFFQLLKKREKTEALSILTGQSENTINGLLEKYKFKLAFEELLLLYLTYRNSSSHGGRIYNFETKKYELSYNEFIHDFINVTSGDYRTGKGRSHLGVILKTLLLFSDKSAYNYLQISLNVYLIRYLKKFPNDKEFLFKDMEITDKNINE